MGSLGVRTLPIPGIGGNFTFSPSDRNGMTASDIVRYRVQNGRWVLAK